MCKVSVIVPVYNAKDYLRRCLDSIINQTLKNIEIICIDDCSTDNSLDILNEYAKQDLRIKIIHQNTNGGESKARNTGIDYATGEYLAFVDNDDTIDDDFYEKLYNKAKIEDADIAKGEVHIYEYDSTEIYGQLNKKIESGGKFYFAYHWWTAIYRASMIKDNNINLPEGYPLGGDVLFLNEAVIAANEVVTVNDTFYNYYRREDSGDSKILPFNKIESAIDIFFVIYENLIKTGIKNDGIVFNLSAWLTLTLQYPYRVKDEATMRYILRKAIDLYTKIKSYTNDYDAKYLNVLPVIIELLKQKDIEGLVNFYIKNNSPQKMFIANLRYLHKINAAK